MKIDLILKEIQWKAVKSSGPGGQHVNKTASKVVLVFNLKESAAFTEMEKQTLLKNLASRITDSGDLILQSSQSRSQHRNKKLVIERLIELLTTQKKRKKVRKKTTPTKSAIEKRLTEKKNLALKKSRRKPPEF